MFKTRYRIVTDKYAGYEVQTKYWWWPWWVCPKVNTFHSLERARAYANHLKNPVVEYV